MSPAGIPIFGAARFVVIVGLFAVGPMTAQASPPPRPLPNPDLPAVTPPADGAGSFSLRSTARGCEAMKRAAGRDNSAAGLAVLDIATGEMVCSLSAKRTRSLASNTKLFTTMAAIGRLGPDHRLKTRLYADRPIDEDGTLDGNLYLKGGGDPSLGPPRFLTNYLGGAGTDIGDLVREARQRGLRKVEGKVFGDESVFDSRRGVAASGYKTSPWIGPLSGLSVNAGFSDADLRSFSASPARTAARTFSRLLRKRGVPVTGSAALGKTPREVIRTKPLGVIESESVAWMARLTNVDSNNFFAEMLVKGLGAAKGRGGSTSAGARVVRKFTASLGGSVSPVDGSGLTVSNSATASSVVRTLAGAWKRDWWRPFYRSLPIAGREGTVAYRMRGTKADGRCRVKTGTLTGVSALSGYCFNSSGRKFAFSVLMNGVSNVSGARLGQDRVAALVAGL